MEQEVIGSHLGEAADVPGQKRLHLLFRQRRRRRPEDRLGVVAQCPAQVGLVDHPPAELVDRVDAHGPTAPGSIGQAAYACPCWGWTSSTRGRRGSKVPSMAIQSRSSPPAFPARASWSSVASRTSSSTRAAPRSDTTRSTQPGSGTPVCDSALMRGPPISREKLPVATTATRSGSGYRST